MKLELLPLIAKNKKGYETILKLSSNSYLENNDNSLPYCNINDLIK